MVGGSLVGAAIDAAIARINVDLPHYQRIRGFHVHPRAFTPDDGLLTANGKMKRSVIATRFKREIEEMYQ